MEAIMNMAMVFGLVQLANKFELDKPENMPYLRLAYAGSQLLQLSLILIIYLKTNSKNDTTALIYQEPQSPFSQDEPKIVETTNKDYDLGQLKQLVFQTLMGVAIIGFMHFKFGYLRPLLLQSILGLKTFYSTPIVKVGLLGKEATGALLRPWKQASPFGGTAEQKTEKDVKRDVKKEEKKKIANKKLD